MRDFGSGRAVALAACLALLLAVAPLKAFIGSILQVAQMATLVSNTASLLQEAEKRFTQLTSTIGEIQGMKDRIEGEVSAVGNMATQLGQGWQGLYASSTGLVQDTLSLPKDLRTAHGGLFDSLTAAAGSATPAADWRGYTGAPVSASALSATLGAEPGDRVAKTLEAALGALQRKETLGTAVRQAARSASETVRSAQAANAKHRETASLEKSSQTALLQKLMAAQLTANELLASLAQVQGIAAAAGTLETEERSRRRNAVASETAASKAALDAERVRIQGLRKNGAAAAGVQALFSLGWMTEGG